MSDPKTTIRESASAATELETLLVAAGMPSASGVDSDPDVSRTGPLKRSNLDLAKATRAISGWYQSALGQTRESSVTKHGQAVSLDNIVRQHVALRREWEHREAVSLASWLSKKVPHASSVQVLVPAPVIAAADAPRRRALLIDDSSDILVTVGAFLEAFGFTVTLASSGEAALEILASASMDLLVTDHAMPGMTGKDLVIEALQQYPALRAMVITGYPDLQELQELPASVTVLAKPFRRAELFARLRALFERPGKDDVMTPFGVELCTPRA